MSCYSLVCRNCEFVRQINLNEPDRTVCFERQHFWSVLSSHPVRPCARTPGIQIEVYQRRGKFLGVVLN